jgi:hypothetical protein
LHFGTEELVLAGVELAGFERRLQRLGKESMEPKRQRPDPVQHAVGHAHRWIRGGGLGLTRRSQAARVGDQMAVCIHDPQPRLLAPTQLGEDGLRRQRRRLVGSGRSNPLVARFVGAGWVARAVGRLGSPRIDLVHAGQRRGEQASLLHHRLLLRAQELALVGVERQQPGGGQEHEQHIERQEADRDARQQCTCALVHLRVPRLCPAIPKGRLRRTISVRPELVEGRDQSQGERTGNPRKPLSVQAILGPFPLHRRRTNAPFDKLRANGRKRRSQTGHPQPELSGKAGVHDASHAAA